MIFQRRSARTSFTILPIVLLTALLAACGSASSTTASTPTATPTACLTVATGTIQSVNKNTLLVTTLQGTSVQATFTSATLFLRQAALAPSGLKNGLLVSVTVKQNPDNTYSALTVNVRTSLTRRGTGASSNGTNGTKLCNGQRQRGTGTPGASGGPGFGSGTPGVGSGQSHQTISGTVSLVSASSLTVTDTSGNDFTIALTSSTRISEQQAASASDLQTGEAVTITGSANSQGVIAASSVAILQALPGRGRTPAATPTTGA